MLYHTSPETITNISDDGLFGSFLFFSSRVYHMGPNQKIVYVIDDEDLSIIEASQLFYQENAADADHVVQAAMEEFGVDEDTAEDLIDGSESAWDVLDIDPEDIAEADWDLQYFAALTAQTMGFDGVEVSDEQGVSYMIDMTDRIGDLVEQ